MEVHQLKNLWKDRIFVWFLCGQTVAQFGAAIAMFSIPWLLLHKTGSAASTGLAFAVGFIPYLLLSLPAGVWADRFSRSKMMITADLGRLLIMASLPISFFFVGETPVTLLFVVQAGLSAFAAIFDAAYGAYLPLIVDKEKLSSANTALQSGSSFSQILGPALGGTLLSLFGDSEVLILTCITYFISILSIMRTRKHEQCLPVIAKKRKLRNEIREGFIYVWNHKLIRTTGIFSMLANLVIPATSVALLFKLQKELHLASDITGLILASFSVGMVIGSIIHGQLKRRFPMKQLLVGVLSFMVIPPVILASSNNLILLTLAYALAGVTLSIWNVALITMRQMSIAPEIMGRALTSIRLVAWCSLPIGNILGGSIIEAYGSFYVFALDASVRLMMLILSVYMFQLIGQTLSRPIPASGV
jgi:MFS family permease